MENGNHDKVVACDGDDDGVNGLVMMYYCISFIAFGKSATLKFLYNDDNLKGMFFIYFAFTCFFFSMNSLLIINCSFTN